MQIQQPDRSGSQAAVAAFMGGRAADVLALPRWAIELVTESTAYRPRHRTVGMELKARFGGPVR